MTELTEMKQRATEVLEARIIEKHPRLRVSLTWGWALLDNS